jgi:hypothetical protein
MGYELRRASISEFEYAMPLEAGLGWLDGMALLQGAPNRQEAEAWLKFNLDGKIAAQVASTPAFQSAAKGALANLSSDHAKFLSQVHSAVVATETGGSTGGGGDPCMDEKKCKCRDTTCSEDCCSKYGPVVGSIFWNRKEPSWLREMLLNFVQEIKQ